MTLQFGAIEPVQFGFDPSTGLASLLVLTDAERMGNLVQINLLIHLPQEIAQALLLALPNLEAVLLQAKEARTKPDFVQ
jgi:hypothetical protein